jgi:preprotein translocase subunit SecB
MELQLGPIGPIATIDYNYDQPPHCIFIPSTHLLFPYVMEHIWAAISSSTGYVEWICIIDVIHLVMLL